MATQKEIALLGAYNLGCTFKNGMEIVHMPADDINEQDIKHVCKELKGFSFLQPLETMVQDHLTFWSVRIWSCPYCGKLYWFTSEASRLVGEQALIQQQKKKFMQMQGFDTRMVPPESAYAFLMTDGDDLINYNPSFDTLDTDVNNTMDNHNMLNLNTPFPDVYDYSRPSYETPIDFNTVDPMANNKSTSEQDDIKQANSLFDNINQEW